MQHLDEEIKKLEEAVKKAPEALMNEDFLYEEEKTKIEKRKNDAIAKRDTKKVHRLEQEELILEDRMRLEELQKLRLAAEMELILNWKTNNEKQKKLLY